MAGEDGIFGDLVPSSNAAYKVSGSAVRSKERCNDSFVFFEDPGVGSVDAFGGLIPFDDVDISASFQTSAFGNDRTSEGFREPPFLGESGWFANFTNSAIFSGDPLSGLVIFPTVWGDEVLGFLVLFGKNEFSALTEDRCASDEGDLSAAGVSVALSEAWISVSFESPDVFSGVNFLAVPGDSGGFGQDTSAVPGDLASVGEDGVAVFLGVSSVVGEDASALYRESAFFGEDGVGEGLRVSFVVGELSGSGLLKLFDCS